MYRREMSRSWKLASSLLGAAALLTGLVGGCAELIGLDEPYHDVPKEGGEGGAASASSGSLIASSGMSSASSTSAGGGGDGSVLIDDMEDGNTEVTLPDGSSTIHGDWYLYFDPQAEPKAVITAPPNGNPDKPNPALYQRLPEARGDSHVGVHFAGKGFRVAGAEIGIEGAAWDASAFKGMTFWAQTSTPECKYILAIDDKNTEPQAGVCTVCLDPPARPLTLSSNWTQYTIPFDSLHQQGYGMPPETALYTKALYVIIFHVDPGCAFDLWLDDISLYR